MADDASKYSPYKIMKAYLDKIDPKVKDESKTKDVPFLLDPDEDWEGKSYWFSTKKKIKP